MVKAWPSSTDGWSAPEGGARAGTSGPRSFTTSAFHSAMRFALRIAYGSAFGVPRGRADRRGVLNAALPALVTLRTYNSDERPEREGIAFCDGGAAVNISSGCSTRRVPIGHTVTTGTRCRNSAPRLGRRLYVTVTVREAVKFRLFVVLRVIHASPQLRDSNRKTFGTAVAEAANSSAFSLPGILQ